MIEGYEDKTVEETLDAVSGSDPEVIQEFIEFEKENKDRTTVIDPLEIELMSEEDDETDDEPEPDTSELADEVEVTYAGNYGYAGGMWFEDVDETRTVETTTRITEAIENGELEVVE